MSCLVTDSCSFSFSSSFVPWHPTSTNKQIKQKSITHSIHHSKNNQNSSTTPPIPAFTSLHHQSIHPSIHVSSDSHRCPYPYPYHCVHVPFVDSSDPNGCRQAQCKIHDRPYRLLVCLCSCSCSPPFSHPRFNPPSLPLPPFSQPFLSFRFLSPSFRSLSFVYPLFHFPSLPL